MFLSWQQTERENAPPHTVEPAYFHLCCTSRSARPPPFWARSDTTSVLLISVRSFFIHASFPFFFFVCLFEWYGASHSGLCGDDPLSRGSRQNKAPGVAGRDGAARFKLNRVKHCGQIMRRLARGWRGAAWPASKAAAGLPTCYIITFTRRPCPARPRQ